jgi:DNA polymerase I-like protein with 3'-5' exonuclease and polymerase domains
MQLVLIKTPEAVADLTRYLSDKEFVAFDTETTGLTGQDQIIGYSVCADESAAFYVVLAYWDKETQTLVQLDTRVESLKLVKSLLDKKLIMHNGVFDCFMVESDFKISLIESLHTDTIILAHLLDENRRVGLKELGQQYFGDSATKEQEAMKASITANGGLVTKAQYDLYKADFNLIAEYGAKDALLTFKLFNQLVPELYDQGLEEFFYDHESMPLLKGPTYEMNTTGLQVNTQGLSILKKTLQAECLEARDFIYKEIAAHIKLKYPGTNKKNTFNIGSSQQLSWLLFGQLGLEFGTLTKKGKDICRELELRLPYTATAKRDFIGVCINSVGDIQSPEATINGKKVKAKTFKEPWSYIACDKKTLSKIAPKLKWVEKLLEYQRKTKLLSTYIKGIESRMRYGVIHPSFLQHGTTSGRYSSRNPNFQNLPRDDKRIKQCIVPRPNKIFVGADYSQLEPRVFAYYSKDERLLAAFEGTDDFYSVIGMEVYSKSDCTPKKEGSPDAFGIKYKRLRDLSKVIALSATYGGTAHQLAPTTGKSIEDTQKDIDNYFERFPGVAKMMTDAHIFVKKQGFVSNIFGRKRRIPDALNIINLYGDQAHKDLPYEARNLLNLAVNHQIQSTGASIVNRAAIKFYADCRELGVKSKLILQVHDSMVAECDIQDAETVSLLLQNAMETAVQLEGIRLEAIPKIGKNLAEV